MVNDTCKCGCILECMGGRSAHPSNWYCPMCDTDPNAQVKSKPSAAFSKVHLALFATLIHEGRVSIRSSNPQVGEWRHLESRKLCSVMESGRAGTLVIHSTRKGDQIAEDMLSKMEGRIF